MHQQGIAVIAPQQQYHPRSGADAAHADHLAGTSDVAESAHKPATAGIQALLILIDEDTHLLFVPSGLRVADELIDRNEQWRIADQSSPPVDNHGQLRQRLKVVACVGLGRRTPDRLCVCVIDFGLDCIVDDRVRIPHVELTHRRKRAHPISVCVCAGAHDALTLITTKAILLSYERDARHQPLHIPLPGARQCLVEVVDVENKVAFRRREQGRSWTRARRRIAAQ